MTPGLVPPGTSLAAARRILAQAFRAAGLDSPELDARVLAGHALGLDHARLMAAAERPLAAEEAARVAALAARRLAREPVARIVGRREFWGLALAVAPAVLVPRPETETVVEAALARLDRRGPLRVLDLGTGSGALLIALLRELPRAFGVATDRSPAALHLARANAAAHGLADRAGFVACDFGAALAGGFDAAKAKATAGARHVLFGNVDPSGVLALGTPERVGEVTAALVRAWKPGGRFVLNAGCAIPAGTPEINLRAFLEVARREGRYA